MEKNMEYKDERERRRIRSMYRSYCGDENVYGWLIDEFHRDIQDLPTSIKEVQRVWSNLQKARKNTPDIPISTIIRDYKGSGWSDEYLMSHYGLN